MPIRPQPLPHLPQFAGSSVTFTHLPLQFTRPGAQASVAQEPELHFPPTPQELPHALQSCGSLVVSTQARPLGVPH